MKPGYTTFAMRSLLGGLLLATAPSMASAESLAGKVGDKRHAVFFPVGMRGKCKQAYDSYVAAVGHSAYVSTVGGHNARQFICGLHLNTSSQKNAEELAMKNCEAGVRRFKLKITGSCNIVASK